MGGDSGRWNSVFRGIGIHVSHIVIIVIIKGSQVIKIWVSSREIQIIQRGTREMLSIFSWIVRGLRLMAKSG